MHYFPVHYHPYYRESFGFHRATTRSPRHEFERMLSLPLYPGYDR